jgi:hypothetical protein
MGFANDEGDEEAWFEQRRHALARLLKTRRHEQAAAIVAVSHYRSDSAWDGDYSIVTLSVPAELYDAARGEYDDVITEACVDVVGSNTPVSVAYRVLSPLCSPEWVEMIMRSLDRKWVSSERVVTTEIAVAP